MTRPADPARDADVEAVRKAFGEMVCCYLPPYGEHLEASCPEGSDGRAANATAKAALARIERRLAVLAEIAAGRMECRGLPTPPWTCSHCGAHKGAAVCLVRLRAALEGAPDAAG